MPARIGTGRNSSHRQRTDSDNGAESAVATIWLLFYVLALGLAITSFLASSAIELVAR